jgi:AmmeMemoRadiSam system protein A
MAGRLADIPADLGQELLRLARETAEAKIKGRPLPSAPNPDRPQLGEPRGLFVTFHVAGQLRGCIGTFVPDRPLVPLIQDMALRSLRDPRFLFNPIRADELAKLEVELSILSPMWPSRDPLAEFVPGKHGVLIECAGRGGCFLPQVATETGWDGKQMLENCCQHKAGLPADAWLQPGATVYLFTAQVFSEAPKA